MKKLRNVRDFGWRSLTRPFRDARRFPSTIVARTHMYMYTYAAKVWDLSIVQGPVSVAPCPNPNDSQLVASP
jgi:hypothetical protein